jgi:hypothetical protein
VSEVLGTPLVRKEDPALLSGRGQFADDLPVPAGTLHAHVIRSPHAHARIISIEATDALAQEGVWAVITGEDVRKLSDPFLIALKAPIDQWSLAVERVRYVGEPVDTLVTPYLLINASLRPMNCGYRFSGQPRRISWWYRCPSQNDKPCPAMAPPVAATSRSQGFTTAAVARALIPTMSVEPGTTVPITGMASDNASRKTAVSA